MTGQELYEALGRLSPKEREKPVRFYDECDEVGHYRTVDSVEHDYERDRGFIALWGYD